VLLTVASRAQDLCNTVIAEENMAFTNNETLIYRISYSWGMIFTDVGEINMHLEKSKPDEFHILAQAKTYKFYDAFFKVRDLYEAKFSVPDLRARYFFRDIYEGGYVIKNTYNFDWQTNKINTTIEKKSGIKTFDLDMQTCTFDVLTYFFYLRNLDFSSAYPNKVYTLAVAIDDEIYNIKCRYLGKELKKIKALKTKVNCMKFAVEVIAGEVFKGDEKVTLWISDDKNHIPLEVESPIIVGKIKGRLVKYENLKYPLNIGN
jgi:hypothetical protein